MYERWVTRQEMADMPQLTVPKLSLLNIFACEYEYSLTGYASNSKTFSSSDVLS